MIKIFPSMMASNILNLESEIKKLEPYCDGFHLDIMDFHFVENLTFGPMFVNAIRKITEKTLWIDLLVENPKKSFDVIELKEGDIVSVHFESEYSSSIFDLIKARGLVASVALDPKTEIKRITPLIGKINHVLLMTVTPGFSGQKFIRNSINRLKELHALRGKFYEKFNIAMDGGINKENLSKILEIGVDHVAIANGIFGEKDPVEALKNLREIAEKTKTLT